MQQRCLDDLIRVIRRLTLQTGQLMLYETQETAHRYLIAQIIGFDVTAFPRECCPVNILSSDLSGLSAICESNETVIDSSVPDSCYLYGRIT